MAWAPQNTMVSFERAADQGADGIELDVQLSADGELVVIHDETVDATTNGTGAVEALPWKSLASLDAGAWFSPEFAGERIPRLAEVLERVGSRLFLNIELKYPMRLYDLKAPTSQVWPLVDEVVRVVNLAGLGNRVVYSSFHPHALGRLAEVASGSLSGFLVTPEYPETAVWMEGVPYQAYHPNEAMVDEALVRAQHTAGRVVNLWTVNDAERARQFRSWGVDGLITNDPGRLREALA